MSARMLRVSDWLAAAKLGLLVMAIFVGVGAGLGAAGFRDLIYLFTWLFTGRRAFGQQGHAGSLHLPFLGIWFVLVVPVVAGVIYGPLIQRFAREARGHGVPEVMLAVAENGGRIRPQVTIVKALASALCIGGGGSVGREGPIVQIGSALASTLGQLVRMSEGRLRVIVACGAAGGISATFNAPLTGLFFGFEIVLKEFSLDALAATSLSAVTADVISRAFFGGAPFFSAIPHDLTVNNDFAYVLVAVLGVAAGLIGVAFQKTLYKGEDAADALWGKRPQWLRPAAGGILLGLVLFALPQMYGVGYPVMDKVLANHVVLWLIVILIAGKILAASLTLWIGGSGGVFAPSLFIGASLGMAFGIVVHHLFGAATGPPAMYGVIAMGGVFAAAAQAPLTSIASVAEMTGNFTLTLPIMLACAISAQLAKRITYGSIYTTKLLRRGIDIERPKAIGALQALTVEDVMQPLASLDGQARRLGADAAAELPAVSVGDWERLVGPVTLTREPQVLFAEENLEQARRQLVLYGRDGLPVLSREGELRGWLTRADILKALATKLSSAEQEIEHGATAAEFAVHDPAAAIHTPSTPLHGFELLELRVFANSPAQGRRVADIDWPIGSTVVAVTQGREVHAAGPDLRLQPGERVIVLARTDRNDEAELQGTPAIELGGTPET
ncbi:MAG TPA: chloride channel protein [Solirubrobacteraceae bacterium]|jgi:CIC family chloride channel protein|nr:chloride channel protein [Solirubrobacteraceae bacterium]